jgi:hypothetical protein
MLTEARALVETTWRGAESLDARASSLLGATGGLGAAALGGLTFGLEEGIRPLIWGATASLVLFLAGGILAAWMSKAQTLFPSSCPGYSIAKDSTDQKAYGVVIAELSRIFDINAKKNEAANANRSKLLSVTAYTIPAGLIAGTVFALASTLIDIPAIQPTQKATPPGVERALGSTSAPRSAPR